MADISLAEQKKNAAQKAVDTLIEKGLIFSGMKIGLGTGSTAIPAAERLAERIADGTIGNVYGVPTSFQTVLACERCGIPLFSLNSRETGGCLDLTIDGADEIDPQNNLIKGGGAALLKEKIIAYNSRYYVIVADSSKSVPHLGTRFPLPIEIVPDARVSVMRALEKLGTASCTLREGVRKDGPVITDNGNMILDALWEAPIDPREYELLINGIAGVVENGLFTLNRPAVYMAYGDGTVEERI